MLENTRAHQNLNQVLVKTTAHEKVQFTTGNIEIATMIKSTYSTVHHWQTRYMRHAVFYCIEVSTLKIRDTAG